MAVVSLVCAIAALAWSSVALMLGGVALFKRRRQIARARRLASGGPGPLPCLLIRPCAGDEPTLLACLRSAASTAGELRLEVVMGVSEPDDSAVPTAERACRELVAAGIPARLEVHPPRGPNRKAAILAGICEAHADRFDVVLNADSNVDLTGYHLDGLVTPLRRDSSIGVMWAPPTERTEEGGGGPRSSTAVLGGSLHAFALLSGLDPAGLVGKLFAVRAKTLHETGGFGDLTDFLGEDSELSRRVRRLGQAVLPGAEVIAARSHPRQLRDTVARHARWMAVIRAQRPGLLATYPLFFFYLPLVLPLAALGAVAAPTVAAAATGVAVVGRVGISMVAQRLSGRAVRLGAALTDVVLSDVVLLAACGRALWTTRFDWRGHRLRIVRGGRLVEDRQP